jgi:hypothetical protein
MLKIMIFHDICWMERMDNIETTDTCVSGASKSTKGVMVHWNNTMSTMHLSFLADLVASGARTSSGFKTCHYNQCAKFFNDRFKLCLTGDQTEGNMPKRQ